MKIIYKLMVLIVLIGLLSINSSLALITKPSNESIQAKESLNQAKKDISEMTEKNIPIKRVNETYYEALQLYSAQSALEEKASKADYRRIIEYVSEINSIKKISIEANDELKIFIEAYKNARKNTNLSEMQEEYNQILLSFNEERFEETLKLIKDGYDRISEIQSSQTAIKLFYISTQKTIKNFLAKYGLKIVVIICISLIILLIFQDRLKKLKRKRKFNNLTIQKKAINHLIEDMQKSYFKTKKLSETEYNIKLKRFKEFIRDIDRQLMVLKEEMFKSSGKNKNMLFYIPSLGWLGFL